jgi:Cellulose binding domain
MPRSHRRPARRRALLLWFVPPVAAVVITAVVLAQSGGGAHNDTVQNSGPGTAHVAADTSDVLNASFKTVSSWGTGSTDQYTITNDGTAAVSGWTLKFQLPRGTSITSLWDGTYSHEDGQVTVKNASWDASIAPGGSVSIGFETASTGTPSGCSINGAACQSGNASANVAPRKSTASSGKPTDAVSRFAPYLDTSLNPPFNLVAAAEATGVKQFNLGFVIAAGDGGCTPEWGGVTAIGSDPVAAQIGALRAIGGDVRISFGGEAGSELAQTCTSLSQLEAAYREVISTYDVNKIDFDVEGTALADGATNTLRDHAIAALQASDKGLQVSFTLPVLPTGLTADGTALLDGAVQAGVKISAVDVMTMDYGDGAAPDPSGRMGTFAIEAATAADAQVATVLGISDDAAWSKIAVTPMIGVNDISDEIFTLANAKSLAAFAASKGLAWVSMWAADRDSECSGGIEATTETTCSGILQSPDAFMHALGAY